MSRNATGRQRTRGDHALAAKWIIGDSGCGSAVQTGLAVRQVLLWLAVRCFWSFPDVGCEFAINQNQMSQQTASVEIHRAGTQRFQMRQHAMMRLAMHQVRTACQTLHQRFLIPKAGLGTFNKLVQSLDQTLPGLFLQIHAKHFNLGIDEFAAKFAYGLP